MIKRIKKYGWLIIVAAVIGTGLFYMYATKKAQTYIAQVMIEYNNSEDGKNPDGTKIDTDGIKSAYIINKAIEATGYDVNTDEVANQINIEAYVTDEEQALYLAKLEHGEEYEIMSDQYVITLTAGAKYNETYARKMLSQVIEEYYEYYGKTYINTIGTTNDLDNIMSQNYDYLEIMELIDNTLADTMETLNSKIEADDSFRSNSTEKSFSDLYSEFEYCKNINAKITAKIINNKITKNKEELIARYQNMNSDMKIQSNANKQKIENIKTIIQTYVDMMEDSGNTVLATDEILSEVYDEYGDGSEDKTTSYDELIQEYVSNRIDCEKNDIETAYNEYIIETFQDGDEESSETTCNEIESDINELLENINSLFNDFENTNADYNNYLGAQHIKSLSSVVVQKNINIKKYSMLVFISVLVTSCAGFVIISRLLDIIEKSGLKKELRKLDEK